MTKKQYQQPITEIITIGYPQLMAASQGWSQNEGSVTGVNKEDDVDDEDLDSLGYGGFLDLD